MIRTRIAPSPTGEDIHIGNLYTAYINWAFARKHDGKFIIRIEDTDRTRYVEGAEQKILQTIKDYGLDYDESVDKKGPYAPYRQSERLNIYKKYAEELIEKGKAYYCTCSKERLDEVRKKMIAEKKVPKYDKYCLNRQEEVTKEIETGSSYVIRLNVPENFEVIFNDIIRGEIKINTNNIDDQVLMKSDGFPTYHLAVVIDDHLMEISHVIRAEEWISSTPKHILLYQAFGWKLPLFAHLPILRNPDKTKLSKRKNPVWASWYLEQGYLPDAILNYLALMGWSHPEEKEIFDKEEFIKVFSLERVSPVGPAFDPKKLEWMNGQ
jgi:glutamyl-tRNA synthetase